MKKQYSRRDFLRAAVMGMGAFLASCMPQPKATPMPAATSTSTETMTPEATRTDTPTPTITETATETKMACFKLLTPEDGSILRAQGKVTFSWEAMAGAVRYKLEYVLPSGQVVELDSTGTSYDLYIEVLSMGGEFRWRVTALDGSGEVICTAKEFTYHKPEFIQLEPTPTSGETTDGGSWSTGTNGSVFSGSDNSFTDISDG